MKRQLSFFQIAFFLVQFLLISSSYAWMWSQDKEDQASLATFDTGIDESDSAIEGNEDGDDGIVAEEEADKEENLRCAKTFNRNLNKLLKSIVPTQNITSGDREGRQEGEEDLFQSMLNLELSQVVVPVLKILGSAAASNATAIDESYKSLPYAVRYQVTDLIKFTIELLSTA